MKLINKDIPRLDSLFQGGEPDENYDRRRLEVEEDSYVLQGDDEDITSAENWAKWSSKKTSDCLQTRMYIMETFRWDNNPTVADVDALIKYSAFDPTKTTEENDTNKVIHLMANKGYGSSLEAQGVLLDAFSKFHTEEKEACALRAGSEALTTTLLTYLTLADVLDFNDTIRILKQDYIEEGVWGTEYGVQEGIMDYVYSVPGTSYDSSGLEETGYILNGGAPWSMFKDALKDILVNGIY